MAIEIKHTTAADGSFSTLGATEWNRAHSITGLTANALLLSDGTDLTQDGTNLLYTTASGPRLQVGSTGTSAGIIAGYSGTTGVGGLWASTATPSTTNGLYIDSVGRIGIGTTSPDISSNLDVQGSYGVNVPQNNAGYHFGGNTSFGLNSVNGSNDISLTSFSNLIFRTYDGSAYTELMRLTGNGAPGYVSFGSYTSATNFSHLAIKHATTTLASVSGATATATNLIPAKANVLGVNTRVTVALGTGTGTTGYAVGDGTDPNRWGDVVGTAAGTDTDGNDATADPTGWFNAANNVVITAAGGNFDGTGSIFVDVAYTLTEAD